jgi:hypothetical protein
LEGAGGHGSIRWNDLDAGGRAARQSACGEARNDEGEGKRANDNFHRMLPLEVFGVNQPMTGSCKEITAFPE